MSFHPLAFKSIRWRLIVSSLLAICIPLAIFAWWIGTMLWDFYLGQLEQELRSVAWIVAESAEPKLGTEGADHAGLVALRKQWDRHSRIRLVIADHDGVIHAATVENLVGGRVSEDRVPGLGQALRGQPNATVWRHPEFDYEDTMYVNVPVVRNEQVVGAIRVSFSLAQIEEKLAAVERTLLMAILAYMALIVTLTVALAASIVKPVENLTRSARVLAGGDLAHRAHVQGSQEINQLADTLNQMAERLQALETARRQYVSDVSHELRAPLASIRGMAETMIQHGGTDPSLSERYLPRIVSQTERLARLATQLLDLAQIESGGVFRHETDVNLRSVVEEAVNTAATQKRAAGGAPVEVRLAEELPTLHADRDRLLQMLINLLDNALRHTPPEGRIEVRARRADASVEITVEDTGPGIPEEHLPHLFERFYRVDRARTVAKGGSGLGLAIVKQIVESHRGTIRVESTPGAGTRFLVRLPVEGSRPVPMEVSPACSSPAS